MTDFTPFEDLLRGHRGRSRTPPTTAARAQALFAERGYREAAVLLAELLDAPVTWGPS